MNKKNVLGSKKDNLFRATDERSPDLIEERISLSLAEAPPEETSDEGKRVSIVLYDEDIRFLEESLYRLKMKGLRSASKSKIIRFALSQIKEMDVDNYIIK